MTNTVQPLKKNLLRIQKTIYVHSHLKLSTSWSTSHAEDELKHMDFKQPDYHRKRWGRERKKKNQEPARKPQKCGPRAPHERDGGSEHRGEPST